MFASVLRSLSTQARWALGGASLVFLLLGAVWVAAGGKVTRSYVANLKNGRIENPGLAKLGAISGEMGFPPALWFGDAGEGRAPDDVLLAGLEDGTLRSILEEALRLRPKDRRLLLGIARQISPPPEGG